MSAIIALLVLLSGSSTANWEGECNSAANGWEVGSCNPGKDAYTW